MKPSKIMILLSKTIYLGSLLISAPYGVCPEVAEPDCTATEAENVTLKHCYIDDNCDTDFHKCCSPTCRLAAPPQPGTQFKAIRTQYVYYDTTCHSQLPATYLTLV